MRRIFYAIALVLIAIQFIVLLGLSLLPGLYLFEWVASLATAWHPFARLFALALAIGAAYLAYGFTLLVAAPALCCITRAYARAYRGPYFAPAAGRWYASNALLYLVRYTFLELITPTPFNLLFYRLMGMKIGRHVQINSTHISDAAMISIGEKATIGGSAVIVAHYAQAGYLIVAPVVIGKNATIGLRAVIMGDVVIGDNARVLAGAVVMPKTRIGAGETWGGVPAAKLESVS